MKRVWGIVVFLFIFWVGKAWAHFGGIIPSQNIVENEDKKSLHLEVMFFHPMENVYMDMEKPQDFGVFFQGKKESLINSLKEKKIEGRLAWETDYLIKRPGDYLFYLVPKPYWEPAEDKYILHYTKTCVNALGLEEGWDEELGLETEIVPLTRPYGLWTGNVFRGIVKLKGKPCPFCEVEVEYYNKDNKIVPPKEAYITQVIKTDANGVFTYACPRAGWWGFSALNTADWTLKGPDGKDKEVEIGAVFWIKVEDMK